MATKHSKAKKLKKLIATHLTLSLVLIVLVAIGATILTIAAVHEHAPTDTALTADNRIPTDTSPTSHKPPTGDNPSSDQGSDAPDSPAYVPPQCTKKTLLFTTAYKIDTKMSVGDVRIIAGKNGYNYICTPDSKGVVPAPNKLRPIQKIIYVGDGGASVSDPVDTEETYQQVYDRITRPEYCGAVLTKTNDDNAYQLCINTLLKYYGY